MTINTQKQVEAIEAGNYQQQEEIIDTSAQGTNEKTLTLAQVISMQYSNKDAERPVNIRNVEYKELLSKRDNPFIQMSWELCCLMLQRHFFFWRSTEMLHLTLKRPLKNPKK